MRATVMVVDDDPVVCDHLTTVIKGLGYSACTAATSVRAIQRYAEVKPALVLLDLRLPAVGGLSVLKCLKEMDPTCRVVMISGYRDLQVVTEARRLGAEHYLTKPIPLAELRVLLQKLLDEPLGEDQEPTPELEGMIGASKAMHEVFKMVCRVAATKATVLIQGESGTGKELVARAIHALGSTSEQPFITVACANIPGDLMESELFGHERGAFTDARELKKGLVEMADQSTLFLDEIGLMPLQLQGKLLQVLETHQFRRVGGTEQLEISVRFIAATNEDLEEAVKDNRFREDLYYRLNVVPIYIPPLRERGDDVLQIAEYYIRYYNTLHGGKPRRLSSDARALLTAYLWRGNVRELKNVIERAVLMTDDELISAENLIVNRRSQNSPPKASGALGVNAEGKIDITFPPQGISLVAVERQLIETALQLTKGNVTKAAALLHLSRDTLRYRIAKLGLVEGNADV